MEWRGWGRSRLVWRSGCCWNFEKTNFWVNGSWRREFASWAAFRRSPPRGPYELGRIAVYPVCTARLKGPLRMYEKHFGLTASPFASMPDPHNLFMTPGHREALAGLAYAIIRRKGFAALVGEAGTGKTTLLRRTLEVISHVNPLTSCQSGPCAFANL